MVKILPVNNNIIKPSSITNSEQVKAVTNSITKKTLTGMTTAAAATAGMCIIGDSCKNFLQTINDNYFQLKTNPQTGNTF